MKMIVNYLNQSDPQKTKELWLTETGWFTTGGSNGVTEEEQAAFALRVKLAWDKLLKNIGRKGELFWYDLRNDGTDPAYAGHNFGLIYYNYRPKPAFYAVKTYNKLLRGREFVGMSDKPYLARYTDTETGDSTYIAYTSGGSGSVTVPQSGSAVHIYDYLGRLTETVSEPSGDITVEVGEEPTFIHCKTYRTEITDMKYDKNKNICTVSGRAEDFETAEITLWDESGNCVQTESAKVGSDGEFHKMFSVSKPGRYTVKICKSEMEAAGSSLIGTAELDASRPQFSGDTVLRGIVTEFDALSGMTVVTGSLTDRVSGEPSDGLVNVLVLPEGADTDNVNLSNAVWIGDAEVKNGVFTCAGGDYSLHLRSAASDREDSIFGSDGTVTYTFGLSGTASEITAETSIDGGGAPDSARLIIAQYKDGSLIDVRSKEIRPSDAADASLTVKRVEGVDMFKAYVWDGSELRPIIPSVSKKQR